MADQTYTLARAAAELGVREDDLSVALPSVGIDMAGRAAPTLTQVEFDRLSQFKRDIHAIHHEGPTGGITE